MMEPFQVLEKFGQISEYWDPKIVAEFNGQQMRLARLKGEFIWHAHANEDEVFYVLKGDLKIEFRDHVAQLSTGEVLVIPRGVEHRPVADSEVWVMLIEPATTVNTGEARSDRTRADLDRI